MIQNINNVCIIGCGLIGGSITFSLKEKGLVNNIIGIDIDEDNLQYGLEKGILDEVYLEINHTVEECDLIIISTPVKTTVKILEDLAMRNLKRGCIITCWGMEKEVAI